MEKLLKIVGISLFVTIPLIIVIVIVILAILNKDNVKYNSPFLLQDIITNKYLGSDGKSYNCNQNNQSSQLNSVNTNSNNQYQTWLFESTDKNSIKNGFTSLLQNITLKKYIDICDDNNIALNKKILIDSHNNIPSITQLWTIIVYEKKNNTYQKKDQKYIKFGDIVQFVNNSNSTILSVDDTKITSTKMLRLGETTNPVINKYFKVLKPK